MKMILVLSVFSLVMIQALGYTTNMLPTTHKHHNTGTHVHHHHTGTHHHKTHPTREPVVKDHLSFKYDPTTHVMTAITHKTCYLYDMSAVESTEVHTSHGLHAFEIKLIIMVDDTSKTYTMLSHADVDSISHLSAHSCNRHGFTAYKDRKLFKIVNKTKKLEATCTKEVIRCRNSKKDRHYNGYKKKYKRTNNDLQNTTQKTTDRATRTPG